jgi:hypothetical protein
MQWHVFGKYRGNQKSLIHKFMDSPIEKKKGLRPKTMLLVLSGVCILALSITR